VTPPSQQPGCKRAKEDLKAIKKAKSDNIIAQVCIITNMKVVTLEKTTISMMTLFSMLDNQP